jgi:hypothetical protein
MLRKTNDFVNKLENNLSEISLKGEQALKLLGSFKKVVYISDIDFTQFSTINSNLIGKIRDMLHNLRSSKNFKFIYLNAGKNVDINPPWKISSVEGCDFNLETSIYWINKLKENNLVNYETFNNILNIFNKDSLQIVDLLNINEILNDIGTIRWFYNDIIKGYIIIGGRRYDLLTELKNEHAPVLQYIYKYEDEFVDIDVGIVDRKVKREIEGRLNPYYNKNWYKILKGFKKGISKQFEDEYWNAILNLGRDNAILARITLLIRSKNYNILSQNNLTRLYNKLKNVVKSNESLDSLKNKYINKLNEASEPLVVYFLDKLRDERYILRKSKLRLLMLSDIKTSKEEILKRTKQGIKCPFFTKEREYITSLAQKVLIDKDVFFNCFYSLLDKGIDLDFALFFFTDIPANRLHLEMTRNKLLVIGKFLDSDKEWIENNNGTLEGNIYTFYKEDVINVQKYLLTKISSSISLVASQFKNKEQNGDFKWMIKQPKYKNSLFIFNDNEEQFLSQSCLQGGGNAIIRPYQCEDPPRCTGIPTGKMGKGYLSLSPEILVIINTSLDKIKLLLKTGRYKEVIYSSDKIGGLGTGIFIVGDDVKNYIVNGLQKIISNI